MATTATQPITILEVKGEFKTCIAHVWALWSSFGAAQLYIEGVTSVKLTGFGAGACRILEMHGQSVRETLDFISADTHSYSYTIEDSPHIPAKGARGVIQLRELGSARTEITWTGCAAEVNAGGMESLREHLGVLYHRSIEKARKVLEKE